MGHRASTDALPSGMATGIGHLPHFDPGDAVEFVLRTTPRLPSSPSLPARSRREGMIGQGAAGLAGVTVADDGSLAFDRSTLDPDAPLVDHDFTGDSWVGLRAFLTAIADRDGPIKVSVTGPVTLGVAFHAAGLDVDLAFRLAGAAVRQRVAALAAHVQRRVPQAQLVVFIDEPAMGSLTDRGFPIGPNEGIDLVSGSMAVVESTVITGLHCCTAVDHRLLLSTGPRVLSVPVDDRITRSPGLIADFLERDGWIAWGAVPTDGPVGTTVERLWRRLVEVWTALADDGCDPELLRSNAIITPVCGLSQHGVTQAERVMQFTRSIARRSRGEATGLAMSVGA